MRVSIVADEAFPRWRVRHVEQVYGKCGKFIDPKLEKNKVDLFCWLGVYSNGVTSRFYFYLMLHSIYKII